MNQLQAWLQRISFLLIRRHCYLKTIHVLQLVLTTLVPNETSQIDRKSYTHMEWDMEELTTKCMGLELRPTLKHVKVNVFILSCNGYFFTVLSMVNNDLLDHIIRVILY